MKVHTDMSRAKIDSVWLHTFPTFFPGILGQLRSIRLPRISITRILSRFSLAKQLVFVGLIAGLIGSAGGIAGVWSVWSIGRDFRVFAVTAEDAILAWEINANVAKTLLNTDRYLMTREAHYLTEARRLLAEVRQGVTALPVELRTGGHVGLVHNLASADALDELEGDIDRLVGLVAKSDQLVSDVLEKLGLQIGESLLELIEQSPEAKDYEAVAIAGVAGGDFQAARLYVAKFLASGEKEEADRVEAELLKIEHQLDKLAAHVTDHAAENIGAVVNVKPIQAMLARYHEGFAELRRMAEERNALSTHALVYDGEAISRWARQIKVNAVASEQQIYAKVLGTFSRQESLVPITVFLTLVCSLLLFLAYAWHVSKEITGLTASMADLAGGDMTIAVGSVTRRDEIGAMARALVYFRDQAVEKARLESELAAERQQVDAEERSRIAAQQASVVRVVGEGLRNLARGDLATRIRDDVAAAYQGLKDDFNTGVAHLEKTIADHFAALNRKNIELDQAAEQLEVALNHMGRGLSMFDAEQRLVVCNKVYRDIYGLPESITQPGASLADILRYDTVSGTNSDSAEAFKQAETWLEDLKHKLARGDTFSELQPLGDGRILNVTFLPLARGGWVNVQEDITEKRRAEAKLDHMARHDALTGLPNRILLRENLDRILTGSRRHRDFAVLCLDLDAFKGVNDTLGHAMGDALLKDVAARLTRCVRDEDVVARLGGDEFAIVQIETLDAKDAQVLATRILETIGAPYELDGHRVIIGTSIGIAMSPHDGNDAETLLKHADLALYRSKADGRGVYNFFDSEMSAQVQARHSLEQDLRDALAHEELDLFYQPLVSVETNEVTGFEALMRWRHPKRGLVSPGEFIPLAEETGLIVQMGARALRQACAQAQLWPKHMKMAVNVSAVQLKQRNFVQTVVMALGATGLAPNRLEIEVTESVLADNSGVTPKVLQQLHDMGVRIALDDFGTGYSSLSYLRTFPIDKIKIDGSFVRDLQAGGGNALVLIRAVSNIGRSLGMTVCAECVETRQQLETIRAEGCTEIQGYLVSRPLPVADIERLYFPQSKQEPSAA